MIRLDPWSYTCLRCGWKALSARTVNYQQCVAEACIRGHIREHEEADSAAASLPDDTTITFATVTSVEGQPPVAAAGTPSYMSGPECEMCVSVDNMHGQKATVCASHYHKAVRDDHDSSTALTLALEIVNDMENPAHVHGRHGSTMLVKHDRVLAWAESLKSIIGLRFPERNPHD